MSLEATLVRIADALEKANAIAGGAAPAKTDAKPARGKPAGKPAADPAPDPDLDDELNDDAGAAGDDLDDDLGGDGDGLGDDPVVTKADMRAAIVAYKDATSRDKAQELMKFFKATSVDTIKEEDYEKVVERATKLTLAAQKANKK